MKAFGSPPTAYGGASASPYRSNASVMTAPSPRGRTPTRGPPSVLSGAGSAHGTPRGTSPANSTRGSSPSSHRTSMLGRKVHDNESREGRLLALLREYDHRILKPWGARVHDIHNRFVKLNFVSAEEESFLQRAHSRNVSFMSNIEAILRDAVAENVGLDASVTRQAYGLWTDGNSMNERIDSLLRTANKPSAVTVAAVTGIESSLPRGRAPTPTQRTVSPSARRAPSPKPRSLDQVRPLPKKVPPKEVPASALEELERGERRRMLEGIDSLSKRAALTASDLLWAQSIFDRLYGVEGAAKFQEWCMELTKR